MPYGRGNPHFPETSQGWPSAPSAFPRGFPCRACVRGARGYHSRPVSLRLVLRRAGTPGVSTRRSNERSRGLPPPPRPPPPPGLPPPAFAPPPPPPRQPPLLPPP